MGMQTSLTKLANLYPTKWVFILMVSFVSLIIMFTPGYKTQAIELGALTLGDVTQSEDGSFTFSVLSDALFTGGFSVNWVVNSVTAEGADFTSGILPSGTLNFTGLLNETQPINFSILDDDIVEGTETFTISLSNLIPLGILTDTLNLSDIATGTITDNDTGILSLGDITQTEGGTINVPVLLDSATGDGFGLAWEVINTTTENEDFGTGSLPSGILNFLGNKDETQAISFLLEDDNTVEGTETFGLKLTSLVPVSGLWGSLIDLTDTAVGTITDNDLADLSINDVLQSESGTFTFVVTLSSPTSEQITFNWSVTNITTDDTDFVGNTRPSGTLTFDGNNGETEEITFNVKDDEAVENVETFSTQITSAESPSGAIDSLITFSRNGLGTITDNDTDQTGGDGDGSGSDNTGGDSDNTGNDNTGTGNDNTDTGSDSDTTDVSESICPTVPLTGTRTDGTPSAPQNLCVDPRQGQPLIVWSDDTNAEWFNVYIMSADNQLPVNDLWFSKPDAVMASGELSRVKCDGVMCSLAIPEAYALVGGGNYAVWMRAWGSPDDTVANGKMSEGGTASYNGIVYDEFNTADFSLPTAQPLTPTNPSITYEGMGRPVFSWKAADGVIWYQIWVGSTEGYTHHLQDWTFAEQLECENKGSTCTFKLPATLSSGLTSLPPGTYQIWMNSWGPAGFAVNDIRFPQGWAPLGAFEVS